MKQIIMQGFVSSHSTARIAYTWDRQMENLLSIKGCLSMNPVAKIPGWPVFDCSMIDEPELQEPELHEADRVESAVPKGSSLQQPKQGI